MLPAASITLTTFFQTYMNNTISLWPPLLRPPLCCQETLQPLAFLRGWRNTVGNLIEMFRLKTKLSLASVYWYLRLHRIRDLKHYDFNCTSERPNGVGIKGVGQFLCFLDGMASFMNQLFLFKTKKRTNPFYTDPIWPLRMYSANHSLFRATLTALSAAAPRFLERLLGDIATGGLAKDQKSLNTYLFFLYFC